MGIRPGNELPGADTGGILPEKQVSQFYPNIRTVAENIGAINEVADGLANLPDLGDVASEVAGSAAAAAASATAADDSEAAALAAKTGAEAAQAGTAADAAAALASKNAALASENAAATHAANAALAKVAAQAAQAAAEAAAASFSGSWGAITGTLADQADLQGALNAKLSFVNGGGPNGWPAGVVRVAYKGLAVENPDGSFFEFYADGTAGGQMWAVKDAGWSQYWGIGQVAAGKLKIEGSLPFQFTQPVYLPTNAYGAGWNGSLKAATEDAVYDKIESLVLASGGTPPSDAAYDVTWNGDSTYAPSKNAVYDEMEKRIPMLSSDTWTFYIGKAITSTHDYGGGITGSVSFDPWNNSGDPGFIYGEAKNGATLTGAWYIGYRSANNRVIFDAYGNLTGFEFNETPYVGVNAILTAATGAKLTGGNTVTGDQLVDGAITLRGASPTSKKLNFNTDFTGNYNVGFIYGADSSDNLLYCAGGHTFRNKAESVDLFKIATTGIVAYYALTVVDEAYDATGWDGNLTAPSKNAIRDKFVALEGLIVGAMVYQGTWNATTNTPAIPAAAAGNKGKFYKVATAGTTSIDGIAEWAIGDWIVSNGTTWDKIDNTETVSSVAGLTGAITAGGLKTALSLVKADVGLGSVDNTADSAKAVLSATKLTTARTISGVSFDGSANVVLIPQIQGVVSNATVTPTFLNDQVNITAQAAGLTLANPTGTAVDGQKIVIRIKDNGGAQTIGYGSQYRAIGITLPTTTVAGKTLYLGMIFNNADTKWDVVAVSQEA